MSPLGPSSAGLVGRVVLCVLVGAALLSPAAGAGPAPAYGAAGDQLVLEHYDGVVLAGIDGAGHRVVGPLGQDPSLAPDGRYLAYLLPAAGDPELWVARVDGTDARPVAAPAAGPLTWSEDGGHVAFVRGNGIAVVPRDGGEVRQVSVPPAGAVDSAPAWAPRGNELAFIRSLPGSLQQLRLWSPDGGERLVAEGGFGQRLTWSPDRRELFYADRDVHAVAVATGTVRTVARPSADGLDAEVPVPSPDGTKVAFGANPVVFETQNDRHYRGGFFVVDASGSHAGAGTALAAFSDGLEMTLGWSPDSRHLVAGTSALEDGGNVWYYRLLAADGSGATTLALSAADQTYVRLLQPHFLPAPVPLPPASRIAFAHPRSSDGRRSILALWQDGSRADELTQDGDDTDPAWAPDGGRLAFVRWYDDATAEVRVLDLATSTHAAVTPRMPNLYRPVWSSDGGRIAFDSDVDLYVADADGGALRRVTDTAPGDPGGWESQPRWSPDGAALVFVHTTQLNEEQWTADELGVIDLATGTRRTLTQGTSPDWSTAGIAFARDGVRVIRPDGTGERLVDPGEAFRVRWSPDRGRLVSAGPGGVRVIEVVAEGSARLVAEGESSVATWTGDGEAVAYRDARHNLQVQPLRLPFVTAGTGGAAGWDLAPEPAPLRLGGRTRIETAVTISRATFETATAVVVARADAYPDALAGAPLAR
jgi:Tol biopolymer transport system component